MAQQTIYADVTLPDLAATKKMAARLAPVLKSGDVVALDGALGAGKTEFCRAVIHALGYRGDVPSPTFTLLQIYQPTGDCPPLWHMDLYRLEHPEEAFELGMEEGFETAISLIEWPSRLGRYLPEGVLTLRLDIAPDGLSRKLMIIGGDAWAARLGSGRLGDGLFDD